MNTRPALINLEMGKGCGVFGELSLLAIVQEEKHLYAQPVRCQLRFLFQLTAANFKSVNDIPLV
jgi:hypothetical protein